MKSHLYCDLFLMQKLIDLLKILNFINVIRYCIRVFIVYHHIYTFTNEFMKEPSMHILWYCDDQKF
jgi:hypothetical protein